MDIIDLSVPLEKVVHDSEPKLNYIDHKKGAFLLGLVNVLDHNPFKFIKNVISYLIGINKISVKDFPDKYGLAWEDFKGDTHTGTHLDAPYHFGPIVNGHPAKTIDQIPLDWCFRPGIILDMREVSGNVVHIDDVKKALEKLSIKLSPFDIVLFYTGGGDHWNTRDYIHSHKSIHEDVIIFLVKQKIKIIGIDGFTIDLPFKEMFEAYNRTKDPGKLWPSHFIGRKVEYLHIENICNLEKLINNPTGYFISCFPIKIRNASAGWVRLIAIDKKNISVKVS
jgi:kynurenine formamidase